MGAGIDATGEVRVENLERNDDAEGVFGARTRYSEDRGRAASTAPTRFGDVHGYTTIGAIIDGVPIAIFNNFVAQQAAVQGVFDAGFLIPTAPPSDTTATLCTRDCRTSRHATTPACLSRCALVNTRATCLQGAGVACH